MNTMIMSVFERTREIGILRAVGWRGSRILRLIATESLFLCILAAASALRPGIAGIACSAARSVRLGLPAPAYPASIFVRAVLVGVVVALVGAALSGAAGGPPVADGGAPV